MNLKLIYYFAEPSHLCTCVQCIFSLRDGIKMAECRFERSQLHVALACVARTLTVTAAKSLLSFHRRNSTRAEANIGRGSPWHDTRISEGRLRRWRLRGHRSRRLEASSVFTITRLRKSSSKASPVSSISRMLSP